MLAATALVTAGVLMNPLIARAADGPFTIDGVVPDAGSTQLTDLSGSVKELGPINSNTTKIGVIHNATPPMLGLTNPNAQVDLRNAWLDTERDTSTGHDWLYFAWERDANSGSGFIAYEFMQDPPPAACAYDSATDAQLTASCNPWANRRAGDFMILWDQQGGSRDLVLRTWSGTKPNLTLSAGTTLDASVSQAAFSTDGFKGEAAVDLTATIFGGGTACKSFANTIPSTVTGNSDTADYKDTILKNAPPITNCTSTTVTTPKTGAGNPIVGNLSIGTGIVPVKDSAVVSLTGGTATPAGSVAFSLCKVDSPGLCTSGGTSVGSTNLTGAAYPVTVLSPTAYVTSAGRYCWRATFSGDSANGIPSSSDSSSTECFTVDPVTPTLGTTAGADVNIGEAITDQASISGLASQPASPVINTTNTAGAAAGGTITFTLYGPDDCTTVAYTSSAVTVSGNGTYNTPSPQFLAAAPGTYHWFASYSGNAPNNNAASHNTGCTDANEDVVAAPAHPSLTTQATATVVLGTSISDVATISNGYFPSGGIAPGTVTFKLYGPFAAGDTITSTSCVDTGTGANLIAGATSTVAASRSTGTTATATATAFTPTAPGKYAWVASYAGNSQNDPASGTCGDANEASVVTRAPASLTTAQTLRPQDSVAVIASVGGTPSGNVTFSLYAGPTCTGTPAYTETKALSGAGTAVTANSSFEIATASASNYKWLVTYAGDGNHLPISGSCGAENFTLTIANGGSVSSP
jgi:hypothetical protein